ncbi:MAG TPA: hypothetical protein VNW92_16655 [Polyangiaceae bacterium]|nr:hypothetical protein [Polyangiaceae bacterium]
MSLRPSLKSARAAAGSDWANAWLALKTDPQTKLAAAARSAGHTLAELTMPAR